MAIGCVKKDLNEINYLLLKDWIYAKEVKTFSPLNQILDRPPGGEILIMQLKFVSKIECVYYTVPFKSIPGKLIIFENQLSENCAEVRNNNGLTEVTDVSKFKISFENFKLNLSFNYKKQQYTWDFPFYNIKNGFIHEKFKSKKTLSLLSGLEFINTPKKYIGRLSDRFSLGQALRCHHVNQKCETIGEYRCDECRFGWYEIADFNCPQGGSKFCGQNHCGEKNEPACPRGYKIFENEDTGICQSELIPVYNQEHILVCQ